MNANARDLERPLYWRGQSLRAQDFRDEAAQADQRRFWHNRAVHSAYGVADGLTVTVSGASQPTVTVSAGLAYDRLGRELVLLQARPAPPAPLSPQSEAFDLVIRYAREGGPGDGCASRCGGANVELAWRPSSARRRVADVPLARFEKSELDADFVPPRIRPFARPKIASGSTLPGNTIWHKQEISEFQDTIIEATVDTSAAGFTDVPCYFAWIQGPLFDPTTWTLLPVNLTGLTGETLTSFNFRIWLPGAAKKVYASESASIQPNGLNVIQSFVEFLTFATRQRLSVAWFACQESDLAGKPLPDLGREE